MRCRNLLSLFTVTLDNYLLSNISKNTTFLDGSSEPDSSIPNSLSILNSFLKLIWWPKLLRLTCHLPGVSHSLLSRPSCQQRRVVKRKTEGGQRRGTQCDEEMTRHFLTYLQYNQLISTQASKSPQSHIDP